MPHIVRCVSVLLAVLQPGCTDPTIADLDAQAVLYGRVLTAAGTPVSNSAVYAHVYTSGECGVSVASGPYMGTTDDTGRYRLLLRLLTRDPFVGCVVLSENSTELLGPRRAHLRFGAEPVDSARVDVVRDP